MPLWTNVMAPPVAPPERFYRVGTAIRGMIEALPSNRRVALLASGHLALEIGGPKMRSASTDQTFDQRMMALVGAGDVEQVIHEATWGKLLAVGNVTPGFLNYALLMGAARGAPPNVWGVHLSDITASIPYMAWDLSTGG